MKQFRVEDNFQTLQVLGRGAFSTVYKVLRFADNEIYALKRVSFKNLKVKEIQNALNEIRILASVRHPNIVGYRESFIDPSTEDLCVVMNFAGGGDLSSKIRECREKKVRLPENLVIKFFYQLTSALYELHIRNVIHRDLKTANIFLSDDWKNVILGDMNVSKIVKNVFAYTQTGTPYYASPEVWRDEPYSIKTDVWSLGCVIYEICMLKPPFNATDMDGLFEKVQRCDYDPFDSFYSKALRDSILKLMHPRPDCRPNCEKILNFGIFGNLKVILGESSLNAAAPDTFNYAQNQLLETIKPCRDFRELDGLLPPPQYSFDLQEQVHLSERFVTEKTRAKGVKDGRKRSDFSKLEVEDDRFAKKKVSVAVESQPGSPQAVPGKPPGRERTPDPQKSAMDLGKSQLTAKEAKRHPGLPTEEPKTNKTNRKIEETAVQSPQEVAQAVKNLKLILPKTAKETMEREDPIASALDAYKLQSLPSNKPGSVLDPVRLRKIKADLVTINTINSTSNDRGTSSEKNLFAQQAKSILRAQKRLLDMAAPEETGPKRGAKELPTHIIPPKPPGLKSSANLKLDGDTSARGLKPLENVKSLDRGEDAKVSKQLVKNKRRVYSGQPPSDIPDLKQSIKSSKKDTSQRDFLDHFARQQKLGSDTNRIATQKSRSPEFKLRKQTADKLGASNKDILGKKRSSSRKPSRIDVESVKKANLQANLQSLSRNEQSQTSNCAGLRPRKPVEMVKGNLENNLKQLNLILKGQLREGALESSKPSEAMLLSEKFGVASASQADYNSKLLSQMKKFRIKSSKERMQVLLNAKGAAEMTNKSDLIARYMLNKPGKQLGEAAEEPKPGQLRNVMSNAAISVQKKSVDADKAVPIDFFAKNGMHGSIHAKSSHYDHSLPNKSRLQDNEKMANDSRMESSWRHPQKTPVYTQPELAALAIDRSIKITRREKLEGPGAEVTSLPKIAQKRASSVGVTQKKVEPLVKRKRGLSNNPSVTNKKNLSKFVIKKRPEIANSDSMRALQGSENRACSRGNTLSNQPLPYLGSRETAGKLLSLNPKLLPPDLVKSSLMKRKGQKNP